jgi:hypothetical protein
MAVKSVEELKSTRPVRALLLRGAKRSVEDNKGQTPMDLAREIVHDERTRKNVL